jgi:hypothetical protein
MPFLRNSVKSVKSSGFKPYPRVGSGSFQENPCNRRCTRSAIRSGIRMEVYPLFDRVCGRAILTTPGSWLKRRRIVFALKNQRFDNSATVKCRSRSEKTAFVDRSPEALDASSC